MRIVTLIPRPGRHETRLDAEISVGGDDGPGEVAVLRLRGLLAEHANSVAVPLLLSDTPVVAYWPESAPDIPADDPIGRHAQRRITDSAAADDVGRELAGPQGRLPTRRHRPGLDPPHPVALGARLRARPATGSSRCEATRQCRGGQRQRRSCLATWLQRSLQVPVDLIVSAGPGITEVRLETEQRRHHRQPLRRRHRRPDPPGLPRLTGGPPPPRPRPSCSARSSGDSTPMRCTATSSPSASASMSPVEVASAPGCGVARRGGRRAADHHAWSSARPRPGTRASA